MAQRTWPTREEWAAKAEYSVRTACYLSQRVSSNPTAWITDAELAEARQLAEKVIRATRTALTKAGRADQRTAINAAGRRARSEYADVDTLAAMWGRIGATALSVQAAPGIGDRLADIAARMVSARDKAAEQDLAAAIERAIARRNTDEGWAQELERRASIKAGPVITRH